MDARAGFLSYSSVICTIHVKMMLKFLVKQIYTLRQLTKNHKRILDTIVTCDFNFLVIFCLKVYIAKYENKWVRVQCHSTMTTIAGYKVRYEQSTSNYFTKYFIIIYYPSFRGARQRLLQ